MNRADTHTVTRAPEIGVKGLRVWESGVGVQIMEFGTRGLGFGAQGVRFVVNARYRSTLLIRNLPFPGPYSRARPMALLWSWGGGGISHERGTPVTRV